MAPVTHPLAQAHNNLDWWKAFHCHRSRVAVLRAHQKSPLLLSYLLPLTETEHVHNLVQCTHPTFEETHSGGVKGHLV